MTMNAKGAGAFHRFHTALKQVYYNARLTGYSDQGALSLCQSKINDIELMTIRPIAAYLAFAEAAKWMQLQQEEFFALISEICRHNCEVTEVPAGDDKDLLHQNRGQPSHRNLALRLTTLPLQVIHIYFPLRFLDTVLSHLSNPPHTLKIDSRHQTHGNPAPSNWAHFGPYNLPLPPAEMPDPSWWAILQPTQWTDRLDNRLDKGPDGTDNFYDRRDACLCQALAGVRGTFAYADMRPGDSG